MNDTNRNPRIVGNVVDLEKFRLPGPLDAGPLRVAMISSNLPKKGLHDFIEVARRLVGQLGAVYHRILRHTAGMSHSRMSEKAST